MTLIEKATEIRKLIEKVMTETTSLSEEEAISATCMYPKWNGNGIQYVEGRKIQDDGILYKVCQTHTSQPDWKPKDAVSLFAKVLIPDPNAIPEWEQPGSTNPYSYGDKVMHNGKIWVSTFEGGNVWEPGVYGWDEVAE